MLLAAALPAGIMTLMMKCVFFRFGALSYPGAPVPMPLARAGREASLAR